MNFLLFTSYYLLLSFFLAHYELLISEIFFGNLLARSFNNDLGHCSFIFCNKLSKNYNPNPRFRSDEQRNPLNISPPTYAFGSEMLRVSVVDFEPCRTGQSRDPNRVRLLYSPYIESQ